MLFIKMRNNKGPYTEPCSTPYTTVWVSDDLLFKLTYCLRFVREDEMKLYAIPRIT